MNRWSFKNNRARYLYINSIANIDPCSGQVTRCRRKYQRAFNKSQRSKILSYKKSLAMNMGTLR